MPEGQVPDGESLEFRVARLYPPLVLVIELAEAGGELPAAGTGSGGDDERTSGLDVGICAVALVGDYGVDLVGIALGGTVDIHLDPPVLELILISGRRLLIGEHGDDDAVDVDAHARDIVDHALHFAAVGDAVVGAHLVLLDVAGVDAYDEFRLVPELSEQLYLRRLVKPREHARRVQIVEQLAAELEIELVVTRDPLQYLLGLLLHIHLAVKTDLCHLSSPRCLIAPRDARRRLCPPCTPVCPW